MHHTKFCAALLLLCLGLWPGLSAGVTYYADDNGSSSVSCTTSRDSGAGNPSQRRNTINRGIACLGGGDTLIVGAGTYNECLSGPGSHGWTPIPHGSGWGEGVQTTIKAETGAAVWMTQTAGTCNAPATDSQHLIQMEMNVDSWILFERLNVDLQQGLGYCTDTSEAAHVTFKDMELKNTGWSACHQGGGRHDGTGVGDINYLNNHVHHCAVHVTETSPGWHCYYLCGAGFLIEGGEVHDSKTYGVQLSSDDCLGRGIMRNVYLHDLRKGLVMAGSSQVYNNIFANFSGAGGVGAQMSGGNAFYNNTMYNIDNLIVEVGSGNGANVRNNILMGPAGTDFILLHSGASMAGSPNLCSGPDADTGGCSFTSTPGAVWVNPAGGDFRLTPTSPAKDAGADLSGTFNKDMTGLTRQAPWDLGACEAGVASCSAGTTAPATPTPASLAFGYAGAGHPSHTVAGATMAPIHVRVMDGTNTLLPSSTIPVTLALDLNPTSSPPPSGTLTRNAGGVYPGVATFDNLSMTTVGTGYTFRATSTAPGPCVGTVCPDGSDYFNIVPPAAAALTPPIKVDQFGYLPNATKVAVLSNPQTGFNAADTYAPEATLVVKTSPGGTIVFTAAPTPWNAGATHAQSGDQLWWFDFSSVTTPGAYIIQETTSGITSDIFTIGGNVYDAALRAALRMFYYQRSGLAKVAPTYTDAKWADGAAFLGTGQDTQARSVVDQTNAGTAKDVRGGWFDAGDYTKYTVWGAQTVNDLLTAYQQAPTLWSDAIGIPESGNGLPDIVDEAKWELDWLLRMQAASGSTPAGAVLSKVSVLLTEATSPPSFDTRARYWGAASTRATAASAAAFAQGAIVFATMGPTWATYTTTLTNAAQNAWTWVDANTAVDYPNTNFATANPEACPAGVAEPCTADRTYARLMERLRAAIYLYARTGTAAYKTFVEANYTTAHAMAGGVWSYSEAPVQDALLYYAALAGSTPDITNAIRASAVGSIGGADFVTAWTGNVDGYRAYLKDSDYTRGSNRNKASTGTLYTNLLAYNLGTAPATYRTIAEAYAHGLHGVNPLGMAYLSRMGGLGAERSATEMAHAWFADGTEWDNALTSPKGPPPGFLTSGPNPQYTGTASPPLGQPIQKSYKDWNGLATGDKSSEITEPGIASQSAYLRLLSQLVPIPTLTPAYLAFGPQHPSNTVVGAIMVPPVQVRVMDANGVLVSTSTLPITLALQANPVGGTLSCGPATCTKAAAGGIASFDTLSVNTVGTDYTFGATAAGVTHDQSDVFAITLAPAAPTDLSIFLHSTGNFLAR